MNTECGCALSFTPYAFRRAFVPVFVPCRDHDRLRPICPRRRHRRFLAERRARHPAIPARRRHP